MDFFRLQKISEVLGYVKKFHPLGTESVPLAAAWNRVLAAEVIAAADVPEFSRSTMDGYAVRAQDTFGAGPGNPAWLTIIGEVGMGEEPGSLWPRDRPSASPPGGCCRRGPMP